MVVFTTRSARGSEEVLYCLRGSRPQEVDAPVAWCSLTLWDYCPHRESGLSGKALLFIWSLQQDCD